MEGGQTDGGGQADGKADGERGHQKAGAKPCAILFAEADAEQDDAERRQLMSGTGSTTMSAMTSAARLTIRSMTTCGSSQ